MFEGINEKERAGEREAEGSSALAGGGWVLGAGMGRESLRPELSWQLLCVRGFSGASLAAQPLCTLPVPGFVGQKQEFVRLGTGWIRYSMD